MTRAGREPAEDVKRRLRVVCEELGLKVTDAHMHMIKDAGVRIVHVGASVAGWEHDSPTASLMARVKLTGQWPEFVDIRCCATDEDPVRLDSPWMTGRGMVPFDELVEQLGETLEEREQVIAAVKMGIPGPYKFERSVWDRVRFARLKGPS